MEYRFKKILYLIDRNKYENNTKLSIQADNKIENIILTDFNYDGNSDLLLIESSETNKEEYEMKLYLKNQNNGFGKNLI